MKLTPEQWKETLLTIIDLKDKYEKKHILLVGEAIGKITEIPKDYSTEILYKVLSDQVENPK